MPAPTETLKRSRLLNLKEALDIVCASERSYYRDPSILPEPIKRNGRNLFVDTEVYAKIDALKRERDTLLAHKSKPEMVPS